MSSPTISPSTASSPEDSPASTDRWRLLIEILEEVLEAPSGERQGLLDELCKGDAQLRQGVERLLAADETVDDEFLEGSPTLKLREADSAANADSETEAEEEAVKLSIERLGPYQLERKIGEGGMGLVYLARRDDDTFKRKVAIKVARRGLESRQAVRRMHNERQFLADLDHPFIARLFDGGTTEQGLPYCVMEYVEGLPIDVFCETQQLSLEQRLDLFLKVCDAVAYAHQNLIVHRDLKPSNILVTANSMPKLLDFGIAKLLDPEFEDSGILDLTFGWQRLLTPNYASPEQVRGEKVTTATDVYSLGVLLYRLLTTELPYKFKILSLLGIERALLEQEPPRPSAVIRAKAKARDVSFFQSFGMRPLDLYVKLRRDLDYVILKALRKEPHERFGSVVQLTEDIERFRRGFPVVARRDSWRYKGEKFLRRHWLIASMTFFMLMTSLFYGYSITRQLEQVETERNVKHQLLEDKSQVLLLFEEVFREADRLGSDSVMVSEALERSVERLEERFEESPALVASLLTAIGRTYLNLDKPDLAEPLLDRALELNQALSEQKGEGRESGDDEDTDLLESYAARGTLARVKGNYEKAEEMLLRAVQLGNAWMGDDDARLIQPLNDLVAFYCARDRFEDGDEPSLWAVRLARGLGIRGSHEISALSNRASVLRGLGRLEEAVEMYGEALTMAQVVFGRRSADVATILNNMAVIENIRGRTESAIQRHREALVIREGLYQVHHHVAQSHHNLGMLLRRRESYDEAEFHFDQAARILEELYPIHPITLRTTANYAEMMARNGRPQEAEALLRERLLRWNAEIELSKTLYPRSILGVVLTLQGRFAEAEAHLLATLEAASADEESRSSTAILSEALRQLYKVWDKPESVERDPTVLLHP